MYEKTIEPVAIMHTGFGEKFGIPRQRDVYKRQIEVLCDEVFEMEKGKLTPVQH